MPKDVATMPLRCPALYQTAVNVLLGVCTVCRYVVLNQKQRLMMLSDTEMPTFEPVHLEPGSKVMLAPLTFGFFVFPEANVKICDL